MRQFSNHTISLDTHDSLCDKMLKKAFLIIQNDWKIASAQFCIYFDF